MSMPGTVEESIVRVVAERGPLTGSELREALGSAGFAHWKACMQSSRLVVRRVGRRYLRIDRKVEGYARLSPSILREFLTYSVVGLAGDATALDARVQTLATRIEEIGAMKFRLARRLVSDVALPLLESAGAGPSGPQYPHGPSSEEAAPGSDEDRFCVLIAGDIVYGMAHDAPRPEKSTGRMVRGSDLDLVVIMDDAAPEGLAKRLDEGIYQQKYRYLINPSLREEVDYTIKPLSKLTEQAAFAGIRDMVPCKIIDEAALLYGSHRLFAAAKGLLVENHVPERLVAMEQQATLLRDKAERHLLERSEEFLAGEELYLFYTSEETDEFD
jgi:hypothetical protein